MKRFSVILLFFSLCMILYGCAGSPSPKDDPKGSPAEAGKADYESVLFDTSVVHQIDIRIAEDDWNDLLANAINKTKYHADIEIDGEVTKDVSFAAKGNSSLFFVAAEPDSSRYSFRINFGKFTKGQTFHGLKSLSLNNSFCDATYMRDHLGYEMFRQLGVPAPLSSYVWLTVNGEDRGLYLAVEDENESFLNREYGGKGVIYKPESGDLGLTLDKIEDIKKNGLPMTADPHGSDLVYTDDDPASYPDIFDNAETDARGQDSFLVIAALRSLPEGTNLSFFLDTDEIIRFFAVHNFLLNYDSYTGAMLHNLVLVEQSGRLSLVPWDYNLTFGTFVPGAGYTVLDDATNLLNQGIDSPLIGASEEERPMWKWILGDDSYLNVYHEILGTLVTDYFTAGQFERDFNHVYELLLPYVRKDPTAFYSAERFRSGCDVLKQFCLRRAESVRRQLNGTLAARNEEQADRDKVDASDLSIRDMGVFVDYNFSLN